MMEPVALAQIKAHLRLDANATGEDDYLLALITAARRSVELHINRSMMTAGEMQPDDLRAACQALLLIVGHWYANREAVVVGSTATALPIAVEWLLKPLVKWSTD